MLKIALTFIALAVVTLLPEFSFSQDDAKPVSEKLCELRQMLCGGGAGLGIAMVCVLTVGLLTIIGKINWPFIFVMAGCMMFYFGANQVAGWIIEDGVECECSQ